MKNIYHACLMGVLLFSPALHAQTGTVNGHEYVDLGLSVKWATCNVGASAPSDYGDYFAWGETETKSSYTHENSKTRGKDCDEFSGNTIYDVARAKWGGTWRMPTHAEIVELQKCTWKKTSRNGHNGYLITSKTNGNSIFLPAAGYRDNTSTLYVRRLGNYWSSTPYEKGSNMAYYLYFDSNDIRLSCLYSRHFGYQIRPVTQ